jgi:hypothetical protein
MIVRRVPMLALSLVVVLAVLLTSRTTVVPTDSVFSNVSAPWMPAAPLPGELTSSWFCPGVPAAGEQGEEGRSSIVTVFNTQEQPLRGRLTVLRVEGEPVTQDVEVAAFESAEIDLDELVDSPFAAAFVEIDGGGGLVEQRAVHPAGESVATCANSSNDEWYLAAGDTLDDSADELVLSNPHDTPAVVDITLATERGPRTPDRFQSYAVPARSVRVIDVNEIIGDQSRIGVSVVATRGRIVVGRSQHFDTQDRTGYVMTLAAPAPRDQWWFAYGLEEDSVSETYFVYNPGDDDVEVQPLLLGFRPPDGYEPPASFVVDGGEIVPFDLDDVAGLPAGGHSIVFGTVQGPPIVVERVMTRTIQGVHTTSVTVGATPRADTYIADTWYVGLGPADPAENALVLFNTVNADATVTVQAITPSGVQDVPGFQEIAVPNSSIRVLDLTHELTQGNELIIRSTAPLMVERVLPREPGALGRVAVWAVPANA